MLHFRAVTNQFTLVFNPVCQCGAHEGFTQDLGSVLLWRINYYLPNDNGHAKNEGKGQHTVHQVIFWCVWWITSLDIIFKRFVITKCGHKFDLSLPLLPYFLLWERLSKDTFRNHWFHGAI